MPSSPALLAVAAVLLLAGAGTALVHAADERIQFDRERAAPPPPAAEQAGLQAATEPQVTIQQYDNRSEEEFRVNNNLYMIRVQPRFGAPYYLVDPEGTGSWEQSRHSLGMDFRPPQWALFRW